jgi:hypothetical protein
MAWDLLKSEDRFGWWNEFVGLCAELWFRNLDDRKSLFVDELRT